MIHETSRLANFQRTNKRVLISVAAENNPRCLFLDQSVSPLDFTNVQVRNTAKNQNFSEQETDPKCEKKNDRAVWQPENQTYIKVDQ